MLRRAPRNVQAKGYDRHIDLSWDPVADKRLQNYAIYRSHGRAQIPASRDSELPASIATPIF